MKKHNKNFSLNIYYLLNIFYFDKSYVQKYDDLLLIVSINMMIIHTYWFSKLLVINSHFFILSIARILVLQSYIFVTVSRIATKKFTNFYLLFQIPVVF